MSAIDILADIELHDDAYYDAVYNAGVLNEYIPDYNIVISGNERIAFALSLLNFRHVYTLSQVTSGELEFRNLSLKDVLGDDLSNISQGQTVSMNAFIANLVNIGYTRTGGVVDKGEFSVLGSVIDIYYSEADSILRVEFFGDEIESIIPIHPDTMLEIRGYANGIDEITIPHQSINNSAEFSIFPSKNSVCLILDASSFSEDNLKQFIEIVGALHHHNIATVSVNSFGKHGDEVHISDQAMLLELMQSLSGTTLLSSLEYLLKDDAANAKQVKKRDKLKKTTKLDPDELEIGDYIVHELHGIGRYVGKQLSESYSNHTTSTDTASEYLVFEYAPSRRLKVTGERKPEPDFLYVRPDNLVGITKYIGSPHPRLSRFGGEQFEKVKRRASKHSIDIAKKLLEIYSSRMSIKGIKYLEGGTLLKEFEDGFKYDLTPDQAKAIEAVYLDMQAAHPMDRLICGDVGFGKTEVALRASFLAVANNKQVAILAPTTILSSQHFDTWIKRYEGFGVNVALLNRFVTQSAAKQIKEDVKSGKIDIIIGTHSLLSDTMKFNNLGLLVIDEEQRFGLEHKEKIKSEHLNVDILSMSATPIPRTMEMALSGVRDISTINTPPPNRKSIVTNVMKYSDSQVKDVINQEIMRGGQVFFVHNNTRTILARASKIKALIPNARVAIAHGQMDEGRIDRVIDDFWQRKIDVLVCTTIIETGLDIPNANTLIVENAHKFGLTGLHQLRGRVGRSDVQGYAYFLYKDGVKMTQASSTRLETLQKYSALGSGAKIAMRDLEMRGAGNLLGAEQSGHANGVGYTMFINLIQEAVEKLRSEQG